MRGNRAIEIVAESEDFYRSSEMPLDGDQRPEDQHVRIPQPAERRLRVTRDAVRARTASAERCVRQQVIVKSRHRRS